MLVLLGKWDLIWDLGPWIFSAEHVVVVVVEREGMDGACSFPTWASAGPATRDAIGMGRGVVRHRNLGNNLLRRQ